MPSELNLLYWDSCVFLSYINKLPGRVEVIEAILELVGKNNSELIVTTTIAKVEVAYATQEKLNRALSKEEEARIEALWNDSSVIELVEFNDNISSIARNIMREGIKNDWKAKPKDAIHLATAQWVKARELNTYDTSLSKYESMIGMPIREPVAKQPRLNI